MMNLKKIKGFNFYNLKIFIVAIVVFLLLVLIWYLSFYNKSHFNNENLYSNGLQYTVVDIKTQHSLAIKNKITSSDTTPLYKFNLNGNHFLQSILVKFEYRYEASSNLKPAIILIKLIGKSKEISKSYRFQPNRYLLNNSIIEQIELNHINDKIEKIEFYVLEPGDYCFIINNIEFIGNIKNLSFFNSSNIAFLITNFLTILGLTLIYFQLSTDHERSRRQNSINLLIEWSKNLNKNSSVARKLIESLNDNEIKKIYNEEPLVLNEDKLNLVKGCFKDSNMIDEIKPDSGKIKLEVKHVSLIRWEVISYLNLLESILTAWLYNIVDEDIIYDQFNYLISPTQGYTLLEKFRNFSGGDENFQSIRKFSDEIKRRRNEKIAKQKT